jgi:hypothetical protein
MNLYDSLNPNYSQWTLQMSTNFLSSRPVTINLSIAELPITENGTTKNVNETPPPTPPFINFQENKKFSGKFSKLIQSPKSLRPESEKTEKIADKVTASISETPLVKSASGINPSLNRTKSAQPGMDKIYNPINDTKSENPKPEGKKHRSYTTSSINEKTSVEVDLKKIHENQLIPTESAEDLVKRAIFLQLHNRTKEKDDWPEFFNKKGLEIFNVKDHLSKSQSNFENGILQPLLKVETSENFLREFLNLSPDSQNKISSILGGDQVIMFLKSFKDPISSFSSFFDECEEILKKILLIENYILFQEADFDRKKGKPLELVNTKQIFESLESDSQYLIIPSDEEKSFQFTLPLKKDLDKWIENDTKISNKKKEILKGELSQEEKFPIFSCAWILSKIVTNLPKEYQLEILEIYEILVSLEDDFPQYQKNNFSNFIVNSLKKNLTEKKGKILFKDPINFLLKELSSDIVLEKNKVIKTIFIEELKKSESPVCKVFDKDSDPTTIAYRMLHIITELFYNKKLNEKCSFSCIFRALPFGAFSFPIMKLKEFESKDPPLKIDGKKNKPISYKIHLKQNSDFSVYQQKEIEITNNKNLVILLEVIMQIDGNHNNNFHYVGTAKTGTGKIIVQTQTPWQEFVELAYTIGKNFKIGSSPKK